MKRLFIVPAVFLLVTTGPHLLEAQGFRNFELGVRAATMGGAFVARADDISSVYYNPAGLAYIEGLGIKVNLTLLTTTTTAEVPGYGQDYESKPLQLRGSQYLTFNIKGRVTFGIGGFAANTMETAWSDAWPGRTYTIKAKLNSSYIRPVVAIKISNHFAVGAGLDFIFARQDWLYEKVFTFEDYPYYIVPTFSKTNVKGKGIGFVGGLQLRLGEKFRIGGRYVSRVRLTLDGMTDFNHTEPFSPYFFPDMETTSTMTIPQEVVVGVMFSPLKNLALQFDFQRTGTREAMDWVFDIDPRIYDDLEEIVGFRPDEEMMGAGLELKNTNRMMFGIEYALRNVALRAGYTCQKSLIRNSQLHPVFPDLGARTLSIGIGYEGPMFSIYRDDERIGGLSLDVGFQYGFSPSRTSEYAELPALYKGNRWNVGIAVGFIF